MGKRNAKFNVLDAFIVVVLVAAVAAGVYFFLQLNKKDVLEGKTTTIRFTVEVPELDREVAEQFLVGAPVVYGKTNSDYGKIVAVDIKPYEKTGEDVLSGTYTWTRFGDKYQADVTIEAVVTETEHRYKGPTEEIQVGANMPFHGKGFAASKGFIVALEAE